MKKVIVLTSMRTGSTWLTFLVRELLRRHAGFATKFEQIEAIWRRKGFVKAHKFTPEEVFERYPDAYIITSTRNPKGRTASQFYFKKPHNEERLEKVISASMKYVEKRQLARMWESFSSRNLTQDRKPHYMWTTFEWMKEDIFREAKIICEFLEVDRTDAEIHIAIERAHQETKDYGMLRKGKVDGWKDEDFVDKLLVLDKYQEMYYNRVNGELAEEE